MAALADLVAADVAGRSAEIELAVTGESNPVAIATMLDGGVARALGSDVRGARFYRASVGLVAGLDLADGRAVVVKAYQSRFSEPFLQAVATVTRHLAASWYPCPAPLGGPIRLGRGRALIEQFVDDPGETPVLERDLVAAVAGLVKLVRYCDDLGLRRAASALDPHPLKVDEATLYPEPHSPIFDFARNSQDAKWIDEFATTADTVRGRDQTRPVLGHSDWSARNVRCDRYGVQAVFDMDSLAFLPDSYVAGQAALTWRTSMDDGDTPLPSPAEIGRFIDTYQIVRGYQFSDVQSNAAYASALWVAAYTARCEHAIDLDGPAHDFLRRHGDELVTRCLPNA
jgi:hypothetical protein